MIARLAPTIRARAAARRAPSRARWLARLLLAAPVASVPAQTAAPGAGPVQMGMVVRPDTVTVGDHFTLALRVRAPRGAQIAMPPGPDSGQSVEAVDPPALQPAADSSVAERTALYRLVAWDTGRLAIKLGDVVVTTGGDVRRFPATGAAVYVRSVLPADTARQVPKPARDIVPAGRPWWWWILGALIALALIGLVIWWWRRRRRHPAVLETDAHAAAEQEFARIEALKLLEAGERGRYVALHVEVLRDYLARRIDAALRSLTSTELLDVLRTDRRVPVARLAPLLAEADLIKFARRPVTTERARELGREARAVVDEVERAVVAEREAAARRAAASAPAARDEERAA